MDGLSTLGLAAGINVLSLGVVCYAIKKIINGSVEEIGKRLNTEREDRLEADKNLWAAFNEHGHKGLDSNDARVTRSQ